jgi:hypothetical protein
VRRPNLQGLQNEDILTTDDFKQMREGLSRLSLTSATRTRRRMRGVAW